MPVAHPRYAFPNLTSCPFSALLRQTAPEGMPIDAHRDHGATRDLEPDFHQGYGNNDKDDWSGLIKAFQNFPADSNPKTHVSPEGRDEGMLVDSGMRPGSGLTRPSGVSDTSSPPQQQGYNPPGMPATKRNLLASAGAAAPCSSCA